MATVAPEVRRPSLTERAVGALGSVVWRHRGAMAPWAAGAAVAVCGAANPIGTAVTCGSVMVGLRAAGDRPVGGRMVLSGVERVVASKWAGLAGLTVSGVASAGVDPRWAWLVVPVTGWPSTQLALGRRARSGRVPRDARAVVSGWPVVAASQGPLAGSVVDRRTVRSPGDGAVTFQVRLSPDVHSAWASGSSAAQTVERALGVGVDTVTVRQVRDDSGRVTVTVSPKRHLELAAVPWDGPSLVRDGDRWVIDLAVGVDGRPVKITYADSTGIRHFSVTGTSNAGKSSTLAALCLPGPASGVECMWVIDGKHGTSCPWLEPATGGRYFRRPEEWAPAIRGFHAAFVARKTEMGDAGESEFVVGGPRPVLRLVIDEATTVARHVPDECHRMVAEIAREGRGVGVALTQVCQHPKASNVVGGLEALNLMAGCGAAIAHRSDTWRNGTRATESTAEALDATDLPAGGGFAHVVQEGQVLARGCRVRFADRVARQAAAAAVVPVALPAVEAAAVEASGSALAPVARVPAVSGPDSDRAVLDALTAGGPMQLKDLEAACPQVSRRTITDSLRRLRAAGLTRKEGCMHMLEEDDGGE